MTGKRFLLILSGVGALLAIPLVAMQFTTQVTWSTSDFIIMGALLLLAGLSLDFLLRRTKSGRNRLALGGAIVVIFLLVWAELAVGVFGSPFAGS